MKRRFRLAALAAGLAATPIALAQGAAPDTAPTVPAASPWEDAFAAFAASDRQSPPEEGGIVFVGSSSIRLWSDLEHAFDGEPVVLKRGFGGSRLSDCVQNLGRLVTRYRPRMVFVYAGDNDLAMGGTPQQVLTRFAAFADGVHRDLPRTRVEYISIKPSPSRAPLLPLIRETNALIRDYVARHDDLGYVDVFTPMLDEQGAPRRELFQPDLLHLNRSGYALWKSIIAPYVVQAAR